MSPATAAFQLTSLLQTQIHWHLLFLPVRVPRPRQVLSLSTHPAPHPDNDCGDPQPQVQRCRHSSSEKCRGPSCKVQLRDWEMEGEGEGGRVRGEMGWRWPHSQEGDCGVALLLRSGRMLILGIYTRTMLALERHRICDCTAEIHFLLMCLQTCSGLVQFIDPRLCYSSSLRAVTSFNTECSRYVRVSHLSVSVTKSVTYTSIINVYYYKKTYYMNMKYTYIVSLQYIHLVTM